MTDKNASLPIVAAGHPRQPLSALRAHPRLRTGKKAASPRVARSVAGPETEAFPPEAPIPCPHPPLRVGARPCPPARLGQPHRLHSLRLRPATPCGGPEAPGSPGPGRMEADASQERVKKLPYHGCAGHRKRTAFFRCSQKRGWEAARADRGRSAHSTLARRAGILSCHLLVGGHQSRAWEPPSRRTGAVS